VPGLCDNDVVGVSGLDPPDIPCLSERE
jgi:hypothetical protein